LFVLGKNVIIAIRIQQAVILVDKGCVFHSAVGSQYFTVELSFKRLAETTELIYLAKANDSNNRNIEKY